MSGVYFKFLFATTINKRPVWITWLLYVITITMFIIIMPLAAQVNPYQIWANTTMAVCQTFLGMSVAIFTAVLAINVFKEGNEEGTELIIISKPISRRAIVWTKFLLYIVFCLMVNLCAVFISAFTIFIPWTEVEFYWGLVLSMFIGNLVCFSVFGSIAVLLSAKVAKIGVIITNIIISLVFLIYQILTLFVFKTPLKTAVDDNVTAPSYVYADRNLEDGSYVEKEFVQFNAAPEDDGTFHLYANKWEDVVDYWQDTIKSKDVSNFLNVTDLAGQISLSYLSVGVNKYSERQAKRMFGISRFWDYVLTSPISPEFDKIEEHSTVKPENRQTVPFVYMGAVNYIDDLDSDLFLSVPSQFGFLGVKENQQSTLAGSFGNSIPVGYVRGDSLFSNRDVYLEQDKWNQYKAAFDTIYDYIYNHDLWKKSKTSDQFYYDHTKIDIDILVKQKHDFSSYGCLWCYDEENLSRYYDLMWAMLTGHSGEEDYLGEDTPMTQEMVDSLEINNDVNKLNDRFIQYKYYAFYRAWKEQQDLFKINGYCSENEKTAKQNVLQTSVWWAGEPSFIFPIPPIMSEWLGVEPVENTWYMHGIENPALYSLIQPGTTVPNIQLILETKDWIRDNISFEETLNTSYFKYLRTYRIIADSAIPHEHYLFVSTDVPTRKSKFDGDMYSTRLSWVPYITNQIIEEEGGKPLAVGQNIQYFFYEANKTFDFWIYAVIWLVISIGLFGAGVVVYNKYDVK